MYRGMRYHTKGGVDDRVSFYKGGTSKRGGGGSTQLEWCPCVNNVWGVQDQVPYIHGLLLGQMFFLTI